MSKLEKNTVNTSSAADLEVGTAADVEQVMKKFDRESNTRYWTGKPQQVVRWCMILFSLYSMYVTLFANWLPEVKLMNFLGIIIIIGYLNYPFRKGDPRENHIPWYDFIIMILGAAGCFFYSINATYIIKKAAKITKITEKDNYIGVVYIIIGIISILALMELCRRCVGVPILIVIGILLIYTLVPFGGDVALRKAAYDLFYSKSGIMGIPIDVCAKYIVVFIIFGAFLERTGISAFFIDLANSIAGKSAGGPAKVAVLSSALCGMVSGSSVGNTVTTGSVTIPMMKKTGYNAEFAGAVEAAASTGGQIMPPIMGAAAFLMAEYTGVPYATIALCAILPAVLYFIGIYIAVHLEAKKLGLKGIPKDQLPSLKKLLPKVYLLAPIVILVYLVSTNSKTMQFSATVAIGVTILVGLINGFVNKEEKLTLTKIFDALETGGKGTISVAVACAMAGLVSGCITSTGLASNLTNIIISNSKGNALIALVLTMLCCIILGMGVPTTATYCIMAATCAPILVDERIGIPILAAHFFVFYFGIVADITPPVALAAYAGSAIAKSSPMKTAFTASRLAIAAFIVPYVCAMNPAMLLGSPDIAAPSVAEIIIIVATAMLGIFGVSAGLSGFLFAKMNIVIRLVSIAGGLTLLVPGTVTDLIGLALIAGVVAVQYMLGKNSNKQAVA